MIKPILFLALSLLFTACIPFPHYDFVKTPEFRPNGSIKVVSLYNNNDLIAAKMEHQLLKTGFTIINDHQIRANTPVEAVPVEQNDSVVLSTKYQMVKMNLFPERSADYLLKLDHEPAISFTKRTFSELNANLIDPNSGKTVAFLTFNQHPLGFFKRGANKVMRQFALDLKGN